MCSSDLAGLVDVPVIAVPTSVGYGVGEGGRVALDAMLQSCAPGIAVVNIELLFPLNLSSMIKIAPAATNRSEAILLQDLI